MCPQLVHKLLHIDQVTEYLCYVYIPKTAATVVILRTIEFVNTVYQEISTLEKFKNFANLKYDSLSFTI